MNTNPKTKDEIYQCFLCEKEFLDYPGNTEEYHCHIEVTVYDEITTTETKHICENCIRRITELKEVGMSYKGIMTALRYRLSFYELTKVLRVIK